MNPRTEKRVQEFIDVACARNGGCQPDYIYVSRKRRSVKIGLIAIGDAGAMTLEIDLKNLIAKRYPRKKKAVRK
jgi:hypothetical protein